MWDFFLSEIFTKFPFYPFRVGNIVCLPVKVTVVAESYLSPATDAVAIGLAIVTVFHLRQRETLYFNGVALVHFSLAPAVLLFRLARSIGAMLRAAQPNHPPPPHAHVIETHIHVPLIPPTIHYISIHFIWRRGWKAGWWLVKYHEGRWQAGRRRARDTLSDSGTHTWFPFHPSFTIGIVCIIGLTKPAGDDGFFSHHIHICFCHRFPLLLLMGCHRLRYAQPPALQYPKCSSSKSIFHFVSFVWQKIYTFFV